MESISEVDGYCNCKTDVWEAKRIPKLKKCNSRGRISGGLRGSKISSNSCRKRQSGTFKCVIKYYREAEEDCWTELILEEKANIIMDIEFLKWAAQE